MNKTISFYISYAILGLLIFGCQPPLKDIPADAHKIDRKALVTRHNVGINEMDTLASLSVGNGSFAMTVDATGLQTFPELYANGVSLGTQSDWGWHSFSNINNYKIEESYKTYSIHDKKVNYKVQWDTGDRKEGAANYFRVNPHRLHLGLLGLKMTHADGRKVNWDEVKDIDQSLDMWKGEITSSFSIDGELVEVTTFCHPEKDVIATTVKSSLVMKGQVALSLKFPYPDGKHVGTGCDWTHLDEHTSELQTKGDHQALISRTLDTTHYYVDVKWEGDANINEDELHQFSIKSNSEEIKAIVSFASNETNISESYAQILQSNERHWETFWRTGGAIDFSGSTDKRAKELERRVVLSQYLTRIQCAGIYPPQETGLTFNSWYGKFHLEMDWWHGVHFALWNRVDILEKRLDWYISVFEVAKAKANQQGYKGARWAKMTSPSGADSPSGIGEFLIWQQPHIIYFADLCFRNNPTQENLKKYSELVFETAEFMASYAYFDEEKGKYVLGPGVIPAQECFDPNTTINPPFELVYWKYGLLKAVDWQRRMRIPINTKWAKIGRDLSPLAMDEDKYLVAESAPDTYTNSKWLNDHPMVLGAYGILPEMGVVDRKIMSNTFDYIMEHWNWEQTWGWDYPMVAMCAARLGKRKAAVDALLMDVQKNTYLKNGHNYQDERLRIYLPGNGGLLTAVAMMCAGFDSSDEVEPGIPYKKDGWVVKWEDLSPMP